MDSKKAATFLAANRIAIGAALAALADLVDMLATLAARRALSPPGLALGVGVAGASAAAHLWLREELG